MANWIQFHHRFLKSARALKAFYEAKFKVPLQLLTEAPESPLERDLAFGEKASEYGLWGFRAAESLPPEAAHEIRASCLDLMSGFEAFEERRQTLADLQARLEQGQVELPQNVISINRRPRAPFSKPPKIWTLRSDCLIEALSVSEVHRLVTELHSHSGRMIMLHFQDVEESHRLSAQHLVELGPVTLFIPELSLLSQKEQSSLFEMTRTPIHRRPILMVGTTKPYAELRTDPSLRLDLVMHLSRVFIKMTRPFREYKDKGLIQYFLDSLASEST
ncbi:MAG: hypothetical protein AB7F86_13665 [Bdellovibrionales bacterium]